MRRSRWIAIPSFVVVAAASCGDSTAPAASAPAALRVTVDWMAPDSTSADFTVTPEGGTFRIGPHAVHFPANSICDPATSSYGVGTWDDPCTPLAAPIRIHAEVRKIDHREWVDFTPALRFVPSRSSNQWVTIWMRSAAARLPIVSRDIRILWSPSFGAPGIDESLEDRTLGTRVVPGVGLVYRRIKHFSGYQVSMGYSDGSSSDGGN